MGKPLNDCCFFTGINKNLCEKHHIFGGANRKNSEKYGLVVYLSPEWHNLPPNGVHHNPINMLKLHQYGQQKFNEMYPTLNFLDVFNTKNYLLMTDEDVKKG